ncbi:MAG: DNA primase family protein [Henriciella sp.]
MAEDPNDILRRGGAEALRKRVDTTPPSKVHQLRLTIGSDNEVAQCVARDLRASIGETVYCDGDFHAWCGTHWTPLSAERLHEFIREYDGCDFVAPSGRPSRYLLNKTRHNSVLHLLRLELLQPDFFREAPLGVACRSGFIALDEAGGVDLQTHSPDHRQRHLLEADWCGDVTETPVSGGLFDRLLSGSFKGDDEADAKVALLAEMLGAAAFGLSIRLAEPKAIILLGETAGNGKTQVLELMRGLLPGSAVASVTPAEMAKEQRRAQLAGVRLNAADELGVDAIRSDTFKAIVTGDRTSGKTVYHPPFEFCPEAFHAFATNKLPPFTDGMDRGVRRRLAILAFDRTIPAEERIKDLGKRIAREEANAMLAMAVAGAVRLLRQGCFTETASGRQRMAEWVLVSDMVAAFFEDNEVVEITGERDDKVTSKDAYVAFASWAKSEGIPDIRRPTHSQFTERAKGLDLSKIRVARTGKKGTVFYGVRLRSGGGSVRR